MTKITLRKLMVFSIAIFLSGLYASPATAQEWQKSIEKIDLLIEVGDYRKAEDQLLKYIEKTEKRSARQCELIFLELNFLELNFLELNFLLSKLWVTGLGLVKVSTTGVACRVSAQEAKDKEANKKRYRNVNNDFECYHLVLPNATELYENYHIAL